LQALLRDVLSSHRQIRAALQLGDEAREEARNAIRAQLERLITPYFLSRTPAEWRGHLPRYLKAAQQRWERVGQRRGKDAELEREVRDATARLERWLETLPSGWPWPPAVVRYRWLLEELRVSLFAQTLGTAAPVSAKRLEEQWRRVHEERAPVERGAASSRAAS
jgi:ATP-dependent helicase HrpA